MVMKPEFIIADEAYIGIRRFDSCSGLNLMSKLQREMGLTYLFISHDLSVMRFFCDRICVIHKGILVELADTEELFAHPMHPYTKALLSAIPMPDPKREKDKELLVYNPDIHNYEKDKPTWREIRKDHFILANDEEFLKYKEELGE
jgi:oligopeptide transport system ATP-binding protein